MLVDLLMDELLCLFEVVAICYLHFRLGSSQGRRRIGIDVSEAGDYVMGFEVGKSDNISDETRFNLRFVMFLDKG